MPSRNLRAVLPTVAPVVLCVVADYIGLAAVTPVLPFHINRSSSVHSDEEVATWVGAVTSAQFGAVVVACLVWGRAADRFGAKAALLTTMAGDVMAFSLTALAVDPLTLLLVRACAGFFSPLVPALAYIFEVVPPARIVDGVTWYTLSVLSGLTLGSAAAGLYEPLGWHAFSLLLSAIAAVALTVAAVTLKQRVTPNDGAPKVAGVRAAVFSGDFLTTMLTTFCVGWDFSVYLVVTAVMLFDMYAFSARSAALVFLAIPACLMLSQFLVLPIALRLLGTQGALTVGLSCGSAFGGMIALPAVHKQWTTFVPVLLLHISSNAIAHTVNQARPGMIGRHFTQNGTGQLSGYNRVCFAAGQALAPVVALQLFTVHVSLPWLSMLVLGVLTLMSYPLMGVSLRHDPAWRTMQAQPESASTEGGVTSVTSGPVDH